MPSDMQAEGLLDHIFISLKEELVRVEYKKKINNKRMWVKKQYKYSLTIFCLLLLSMELCMISSLFAFSHRFCPHLLTPKAHSEWCLFKENLVQK